MELYRKQKVKASALTDFQIGDQIVVGKYTATCQKVADQGAIFMLDSYLDKPYQMNVEGTNEGRYEASDLQRNLVVDFSADENFDSIRNHLTPFENGYLVRIPTIAEFFGHDDSSVNNWFEVDDAEQWYLMKIPSNRIAQRKGDEYEWGWLQNKAKKSVPCFVLVTRYATYNNAPNFAGVRPVFMIKKAVN